eukprot:jgi/Ulvmu1/4554/UM002_0282.1
MRVCSRVSGLPPPQNACTMPQLGVHMHYARCKLAVRPRVTVSCSAEPGPVFVSVPWLQAHLNDVAIIDARGKVDTEEAAPGVEKSQYFSLKDAYLERHIPNATFWDWTTDAIDFRRSTPVQLDLNADSFAATAEEKGISTELPVVVYDDGESGSMFACRVWWSLLVHGHTQAHVLEGGWQAWGKAGGPTEIDEPCPLKVMAAFEAEMRPELYADIKDVVHASQQPNGAVQILDVRSLPQYHGTVRRSKHAGRVPGAKSMPYKQLLRSGQGLLEKEELRQVFAGAGIDLTKRIIVYCNGGVSACVAAAAIQSLSTEKQPTSWSVYDGSWNEYGNQDVYPFDGG